MRRNKEEVGLGKPAAPTDTAWRLLGLMAAAEWKNRRRQKQWAAMAESLHGIILVLTIKPADVQSKLLASRLDAERPHTHRQPKAVDSHGEVLLGVQQGLVKQPS